MRGVRERKVSHPAIRFWIICVMCWVGSLVDPFPNRLLCAQEVLDASRSQTQSQKYSPSVVTKATEILKDIGIRQSGKNLSPLSTASISRAVVGLTKEKRQLRLLNKDWKAAAAKLNGVRAQIRQLRVQDGELNLQLAKVTPGDVTSNNRLVAMINGGRAKRKLLTEESEAGQKVVQEKRIALSEAESAYAETVLAIRDDFESAKTKLADAIRDPKVKIALGVMHRNFETPDPKTVTASTILATLEKRIQHVEEEIFSESIPLEVGKNGSLRVDVIVGSKTTRMTVDSGSSFVTLPALAAQQLGVTVPEGAPDLRLVLADGREIRAKFVQLPRVRVGKFEAENVRAAVLEANAVNAEPLLGMSFLSNFKFEINAVEKTLKLLRVNSE